MGRSTVLHVMAACALSASMHVSFCPFRGSSASTVQKEKTESSEIVKREFGQPASPFEGEHA